jgi:hypothetical protein
VACATLCSWDGDGVGNGEEATDVEDGGGGAGARALIELELLDAPVIICIHCYRSAIHCSATHMAVWVSALSYVVGDNLNSQET